MIITCEQCQARFKLADEKLKAEGTKVRCSKCQSIFTVFPPSPAPEEPADAGNGSLPPFIAAEPEPVTTASLPAGVAPEAEFPESGTGGMEFDFGAPDPPQETERPGDAALFADGTSDDRDKDFSAKTDGFSAEESGDANSAPGEFEFDSPFTEALQPQVTESLEEDPSGFDFGEAEAEDDPVGEPLPGSSGEFSFAGEPPTDVTPGEFAFDEDPAAAESGGFAFDTAGADTADSDETPATGFGEVSFGDESNDGFFFDSPATAGAPPPGGDTPAWEEPGDTGAASFDFEEPTFESQAEATAPKPQETGLGFGEIDFSDDDEERGSHPSFDNEPAFTPPPPVEPPPPSPPPPPVQRQTTVRPRIEEAAPRRAPASKLMIGLIVLLLALCAAGVYLFMSGDGARLTGQLLMKIKGGEPAGPVEQRIGLNITGSSYVNNGEAGQLLVVQGTASNNFSATRSAISVKGLLLDAAGKTIQQQTVFCGNYLSEERLRTLKYAEIEEAMSNQFGDSLSNMNVKPATALRFTIVFRNVPKEMANISVEVVDSKPGSS